MLDRASLPRSNRAAALLCVFAIHAAVLTVLFTHRGTDASPNKSGDFTVMSLNSEANVRTKPPPPALPSKIAEQFQPLISFSLSDFFDTEAQAGTTGNCSPLGVVSSALQSDPAALAAIRTAPPETRSIANAVVLWNAGWSPAAMTSDAPLGPAREVVLNDLQSIDDSCLDEQVIGPRLVPIPDGDGTLFLVIGSGLWTWRDLFLETMLADPLAAGSGTRLPGR